MLKIEVKIPSLSSHRPCVRGMCSVEYDLLNHPSVRDFLEELKERYPEMWGILTIDNSYMKKQLYVYKAKKIDTKINEIGDIIYREIENISCKEFFGRYDIDIRIK